MAKGPAAWNRSTGFPVGVAARMLGIRKAYFYGVLLACGIRPKVGKSGRRGSPPKLITGAQLDDIRKRLKEARP